MQCDYHKADIREEGAPVGVRICAGQADAGVSDSTHTNTREKCPRTLARVEWYFLLMWRIPPTVASCLRRWIGTSARAENPLLHAKQLLSSAERYDGFLITPANLHSGHYSSSSFMLRLAAAEAKSFK